MQIEELRVKITAEMASLRKALQEMQDRMKSVDSGAKNTQRSVDGMTSSAKNGLTETAAATAKVVDEVKKAISEFDDWGKVIANTKIDSKDIIDLNLDETKENLASTKQEIGALYEELDRLRMKQAEMYETGKGGTPEYQQLTAQIAMTEAELNNATEKARQFSAALHAEDARGGVVQTTQAIEDMKLKMEDTAMKLQEAQAQLQAMSVSPDFGSDEMYQQEMLVASLINQYQQLGSAVSAAQDELRNAPEPSKWDAFKAKLADIGSGFANIAQKAAGLGAKVASGIGSAVSACAKMTKQLGKVASKMNPIPKLANKLGKAFSTLGSKIKTAFIYSAVNSWFNSIKQQISSYLSVDAGLQSALRLNKGAWLTAFQPIYEFVIPALTKLLNFLTLVGYKFAQFTSLLNGKSVSANQKSAEALYNTAEAAGAAGGAAEEAKKQLAAFDELNVLQDNKSSGGGGGGAEQPSVEFGDVPEMEEYATWGEAFGALLDRLIAKLPAFNELMGKAADSINKFSANLLEMFTADGIQEKVTTLATGIAEGFNTLLHGVNWDQLGQSIGAGFQTALNFAVNFIRTFDWKGVGTAIADFINGAFKQINFSDLGEFLVSGFNILWQTASGFVERLDWASLGTHISETITSGLKNLDVASMSKTISGAISGLLTTANNFLKTTDWKDFGKTIVQKIKDIFTNFDFKSIMSGLGEFVGRLIKALGELIAGAFEGIGDYFQDKIEECGGNIVEGILKGIVDAIVGIGTWIYDNIFKPFIDGFKKAFGIHSPSTVMAEQGQYIIEGMLQGIKDAWKNIKKWFSDVFKDMKQWCKDCWNNIKDTATTTWTNIKTVVSDKCKAIKEDVEEKWTKLKEKLNDLMENIKKNLEDKWNHLKTNLSTTVKELKDDIEDKWTKFKAKLSDITENLKKDLEDKWSKFKANLAETVSNLKKDTEEKWTKMKDAIGTTMANMKSDLETKWDNLKSAVSTTMANMKSDLETKWDNMKSAIGTTMQNLKTDISTKWDNMKSTLGTAMTNMRTDLEDKWTTMKNNFNSTMDTLKTNLSTKWNDLKSTIGTTVTNLRSDVESKWTTLKTNLNSTMDTMKSNLSTKWDNIKSDFSTKASNIKSAVENTFTNMKTGVTNIFSGLATAVKTPINSIIGFINKMLSGITSGINAVIDKANTLHWTVPSWVPLIGGSTFGFNFSRISGYSIPYLAEGGVITSPTLAMMGEYAGANTNPEIVAPQKLLQETMAASNNDLIDTLIQLNRQLIAAIMDKDMSVVIGDDEIANSVQKSNNEYFRRTGKPLFAV